MTHHIFGGNHGHYQITQGNTVTPVAFVRRNQTGGGYTVQTADKSKSMQIRSLPATETADQQAAQIMRDLHNA